MKEGEVVADSSLGLPLGDRALWDMESPDHECECPGPPPQFYLPPPPRPSPLMKSDCSENIIPGLETCEAVPVIDAEYHFSPTIPSLAIILIAVVAVAVFLFIGTFLVLLKKRRMKNLFFRKSSPHCDAGTVNGVIYEDLTNFRPRALPSHCPIRQETLRNIEMMNVTSYPNHSMFSPMFICQTSPMLDSTYNSQDLFNPVYEELSNGSGERCETDSEGMPQPPISEDEFAEDELSLGGEAESHGGLEEILKSGSFQGSFGNDVNRDVDSSDADDKSKFLKNCRKNVSLPPEYRGRERKAPRGPHLHTAPKIHRNLEKRKIWRNKAIPSSATANRVEFHEDLLLKKILQIYPNATGFGSPHTYSGELTLVQSCQLEAKPYQSLAAEQTHLPRPNPEIFTTFRAIRASAKNQSQEDSLGSDSGYSNNTSGGNPQRNGKDCMLTNHSDSVLS